MDFTKKEFQMDIKVKLINQIRSRDNNTALQAVEEMRIRGWLSDGSLRGITLIRAQLQGADLTEADLSYVDFHQAEMEFVDLSKSNLRGAKLTSAKLISANLSGADLTHASLYKTNLRGCRNLTGEQLIKAKRLWGSILPDGDSYDGRYNLSADLETARLRGVITNDHQAMAEFYGVSLEKYLSGQEQGVAEASPMVGA
jgi:uncharacterized protein YjbI with pentapeptide repeats